MLIWHFTSIAQTLLALPHFTFIEIMHPLEIEVTLLNVASYSMQLWPHDQWEDEDNKTNKGPWLMRVEEHQLSVHRKSIFWIASPQCTRYLKNKIHKAHRFIFNFYCISQPILQYNDIFENNTEHNNEWVDWFQFSSDPDWFQLQHVQSTWNSFFKYLFFSDINIKYHWSRDKKAKIFFFFLIIWLQQLVALIWQLVPLF